MSRARSRGSDLGVSWNQPMFVVVMNRDRLIGTKVFASQTEAGSVMEQEVMKLAKRAARRRRRTKVTVFMWSEQARVQAGRRDWLFHIVSTSHLPRGSGRFYGDEGCVVTTIAHDGTV